MGEDTAKVRAGQDATKSLLVSPLFTDRYLYLAVSLARPEEQPQWSRQPVVAHGLEIPRTRRLKENAEPLGLRR